MVARGELSPLLDALYRTRVDRHMETLCKCRQLVHSVRYMDDLVPLARWPWSLRRALATLFLTGIGRGELLALLWNRVDFEQHDLSISRLWDRGEATPPKTGKPWRARSPKRTPGRDSSPS